MIPIRVQLCPSLCTFPESCRLSSTHMAVKIKYTTQGQLIVNPHGDQFSRSDVILVCFVILRATTRQRVVSPPPSHHFNCHPSPSFKITTETPKNEVESIWPTIPKYRYTVRCTIMYLAHVILTFIITYRTRQTKCTRDNCWPDWSKNERLARPVGVVSVRVILIFDVNHNASDDSVYSRIYTLSAASRFTRRLPV